MSDAGRLRIGLCGVGRMGTHHLRLLLARDDVEVAAIADSSAVAVAAAQRSIVAAQRGPAREFADVGALVAADGIDALILATPASVHVEHSALAVAAGLPVLVEKPLCTSVEQGARLVDDIAARAAFVMVGHVERFNPVYGELERLVRAAPGRTWRIEARRSGGQSHQMPDVGLTLDLGIHDIDLACRLLHATPRAVNATGTPSASDGATITADLTFADGSDAHLVTSWSPTATRSRTMSVTSTDVGLEVDFIAQQLVVRERDCPPLSRVFGGQPLEREHDAFIGAIRSGRDSPVSAADGLRAVRVACAIDDAVANPRTRPASC